MKKEIMSNNLRKKIYDMSNSFLPLDMFYNDIDNMSKYPSFNSENAFKDLEKIANFIDDCQQQLAIAEKALELACGHISCLDVDGFKCNGEKNCIECQKNFIAKNIYQIILKPKQRRCWKMSREIKDMKIKRLTSKVTDLEAKLAESESKRKILEEKVKWLSEENEECFVDGQKYNELREQKDKEIQELKQQLAEKDKEIAYMTKQAKKFNNEAQKYYEDAYCNDFQKQTKIDFAVEQLEKVKELMRSIDMPNKPELYNNDMFGAGFDSHYIRVEKLIDNQINELKGLDLQSQNEKLKKYETIYYLNQLQANDENINEFKQTEIQKSIPNFNLQQGE